MIVAGLFLLAGFAVYLAIQLHAVKTENTALRKNVAQLMQRLKQRS